MPILTNQPFVISKRAIFRFTVLLIREEKGSLGRHDLSKNSAWEIHDRALIARQGSGKKEGLLLNGSCRINLARRKRRIGDNAGHNNGRYNYGTVERNLLVTRVPVSIVSKGRRGSGISFRENRNVPVILLQRSSIPIFFFFFFSISSCVSSSFRSRFASPSRLKGGDSLNRTRNSWRERK